MAADGTKRPRAAATRFGPDGLTESQILRRKGHREKYLRKSAPAGDSLHVTFASDGESLEITHVWDHRPGVQKVFEDGNALLRRLRAIGPAMKQLPLPAAAKKKPLSIAGYFGVKEAAPPETMARPPAKRKAPGDQVLYKGPAKKTAVAESHRGSNCQPQMKGALTTGLISWP
jgi:hypothetical protein